MSDVPNSPVMHRGMAAGAGRGDAASGAAGWLTFAAAPTFAVMAVWTGAFGGQPDMLYTTDASPLNGMALMYALMSASHSAPWLKLVSGRGGGGRPSLTARYPRR